MIVDFASQRKTVILAGTGRSGTTWLTDIINFRGNYRVMFEPFHSNKINILKDWNYRQYLRIGTKDKKYLKPAKKILSGKIRHRWIDRFNNGTFYGKRIIKDIRINLLLSWIKENFPHIRIILLLRHPCATAVSKIKLKWDSHLEDFLTQEFLMDDHLNEFKLQIINANDDFSKHIFMWCIENYIPLKLLNNELMHTVFYENLCTSYEEEVKYLFDYLDIGFDSEVLKIADKASTLSRNDSQIVTGGNLVTDWKNHITEVQMKKAVEILKLFGLDKIYNESFYPLVNTYKWFNER